MWLLGARRQSWRQSRHSRRSSQQSLRRREACKGFGRASGTVRKSFEQSPARDGSAKPEAQGGLQSFWGGQAAGGSLGGSRGIPEGAVSKASGAGKPAKVLGGPAEPSEKALSKALAETDQRSLRRREACRAFGGATRQSRNHKTKALGKAPPETDQQSLRRREACRAFGGPGGSLGTIKQKPWAKPRQRRISKA